MRLSMMIRFCPLVSLSSGGASRRVKTTRLIKTSVGPIRHLPVSTMQRRLPLSVLSSTTSSKTAASILCRTHKLLHVRA